MTISGWYKHMPMKEVSNNSNGSVWGLGLHRFFAQMYRVIAHMHKTKKNCTDHATKFFFLKKKTRL